MRKVFLFIVLVGAAFSGGAVVNGPGLAWFQALVLGRIGIGEEKAPEVVVADGKLAGPGPIHEDVPATPIPPLDLEPIAMATRTPAATPVKSQTLANTPLPLLSRESEKPSEPASTPALEPLSTSKDREHDALVLAASTTDAKPPLDTTTTADADVPSDWAAVRRELKALGVSRYGTEGDPSGKVRFHCVIPLAGRKAVGQHFEAEGDDDLQAARAGIRRVSLWRATEADVSR